MKVQELFEEMRNLYLKRLTRELKLKKLGTGAFAHVFQHPAFSNVVVKIFTDEDTAYRRYLTFVQANQSNSYLPQVIGTYTHNAQKIKGYKKATRYEYDPDDLKYTIVFMGKYQKFNRAKFKQWSKTFVSPLLKPEEGDEEDFIPKTLDLDDFNDWGTLRNLSKQTKASNLASLCKFLYRNRNDIDLHDGNMMFREDFPVFTDPVA